MADQSPKELEDAVIREGILTTEQWRAAWADLAVAASVAGVSAQSVALAMVKATRAGLRAERAAKGVREALLALYDPRTPARDFAAKMQLPALDGLLAKSGGLVEALKAIYPTLAVEAKSRGTSTYRLLGILLGSHDAACVGFACVGVAR